MSVRLPADRRELIRLDNVRPVRRATRRGRWWVLGALLVALAWVPALLQRAAGLPSTVPWALAAFLAMTVWANVAHQSHARARTVAWTFAAAAALAVLALLVRTYEAASPGGGAVPTAAYLLLLPHLGIAAGAALAASSRRLRTWRPNLTADALLILLAGAAAMLRFVAEPMLTAGGASHLAIIATLQTVAGLPVLAAALLVLHRGSVLSPRSAVLLLGATVVFAAATVLTLAGVDPEPFHPGDGFDGVWLGGWLLFAGSGLLAREESPTGTLMLARRRTRDLLRKLIVPGAALFMAVAVIDIGLGRPPRSETVTVLALFGVVLAVRTAHAFKLTDREAEQRRRLAHTHALVEVTHSLAGTMDLGATLRTISESARKVFGTRAAGIELVTGDGRSLEMRSAVGLPDTVLGLRFPIEGSFTGWVVRQGTPRATVDPTRDPYIQPKSLDFLGHWPVAAAPIRFHGETLGALFACIRGDPFDAEELELLSAMAEQAAIAIQNARLFEQVSALSVTDPLTGLANRRQLERELAREFAAARRGRDLTAVIFDLDEFKDFNDAYGHLAGDEALQAFANALKEETRTMNLVARYGGDEFVALLGGADARGARSFIERVRKRFAEHTATWRHGQIAVSAGLAVFHPDMPDTDALLRAADQALYRSKSRVRM